MRSIFFILLCSAIFTLISCSNVDQTKRDFVDIQTLLHQPNAYAGREVIIQGYLKRYTDAGDHYLIFPTLEEYHMNFSSYRILNIIQRTEQVDKNCAGGFVIVAGDFRIDQVWGPTIDPINISIVPEIAKIDDGVIARRFDESLEDIMSDDIILPADGKCLSRT